MVHYLFQNDHSWFQNYEMFMDGFVSDNNRESAGKDEVKEVVQEEELEGGKRAITYQVRELDVIPRIDYTTAFLYYNCLYSPVNGNWSGTQYI